MRRRWSRLLLQHGERCFSDHAATLGPGEIGEVTRSNRRLRGRLHVASLSLTFEPDEASAPLLRVLLREAQDAPVETEDSQGAACIKVCVSCVYFKYESKQPFRSFSKPDGRLALHFCLLHDRLPEFVQLCSTLHKAAKLSEAKAALYLEKHLPGDRRPRAFDLTSLEDPLEPHKLELDVTRVTPMLSTDAILLLTPTRLYLQSSQSEDSSPVLCQQLAGLRRAVRRRHLMRHTALELHFAPAAVVSAARAAGSPGAPVGADATAAAAAAAAAWSIGDGGAASGATASSSAGWGAAGGRGGCSLLLVFGSPADREEALAIIERLAPPPSPPPPSQRRALREATERWRHGLIGNFDYLLFLNDCAGRSFHDLAQYPVMPWVLSDYTSASIDLNDPSVYRDLSRPIGALNAERLAVFRERFASLPHGEAFMYGTHYSTPAFVSYFLIRAVPELTLHLHGGKFDDADRLFFSIAGAWRSALTHSADVKELIPEFYMPELHAPRDAARPRSFLLNAHRLELGVRQSGEVVGDVLLPPWASDPHHFVAVCRAALESEHASRALHGWIDLVFGYKQRGAEAVEADNVFCPQTYEGAVEMEGIPPIERAALEVQIAEFGQTPTQLFTSAHPQRLPGASTTALASEAELGARLDADDSHVALLVAAAANSVAASCPTVARERLVAVATARQPLRVADMVARSSVGSPAAASQPSAACGDASAPTPGSAAAAAAAVAGSEACAGSPRRQASSDSVCSSVVGTVALTPRGVESCASTGCADRARSVSSDAAALLCSSGDPLRLFSEPVADAVLAEDGQTLCAVGGNVLRVHCTARQRQLRAASVGRLRLSSCTQVEGLDLLCLGSWDDCVHLYSVGRGRVQQVVRAHEDSVSALCVAGGRLLSGSWDSSVKLWAVTPAGISATPLRTLGEHDDQVLSVNLPASTSDAHLCISGSRDGTVCLWDSRAPHGPQRLWHLHRGGASGVAMDASARLVASCSTDGSVAIAPLAAAAAITLRACGAGPAQHCLQMAGDALLTGGDEDMVFTWCLRERWLKQTVRTSAPVRSMHLSARQSEVRADGIDLGLLLGLETGECELWKPALSTAD